MKIGLFTGYPAAYMPPPNLSEEMVIAGPDWPDALSEQGRLLSLKTPIGAFSAEAILSKIPSEQLPDVLVCLLDATKRCLPQNLGFFRGPKVLLIGDTHHLKSPLGALLGYAGSEPFDRIIFLYDRHHAGIFRAAGFQNLFWFPGLTFPHSDQWVVQSQKVRSRSASIGFVDKTTPHHPRQRRLLEALKSAGLPLVQKIIPQTESLAFYASSLMGLNSSLNGDLNLRNFEILASGSLLLTDRLSPDSGLDCLAESGCRFETYSSKDDLIDKARHFLRRPREAFELAKKGREWFQAHMNEGMRRAMFQGIAVSGIAPELFPLPQESENFHFETKKNFTEAIPVYETIQELHQFQEEVLIGIGAGQMDAVTKMFSTLPRVRILGLESGAEFDLAVGAENSISELLALKPKSVWIPFLEGDAISRIGGVFTKDGYAMHHEGCAFFQLTKITTEKMDFTCAHAREIFQTGDYAQAFEIARQEFEINNQSVAAAKLMADVFLKLGGQAGKAELLLKHAIRFNNDDSEIRPALAEACLQGGRPSEAMEWVRKSIAVNPENLRAMRVLAKIHEEAGNLDATRETLELAILNYPLCVDTLTYYALILRKSGSSLEGLRILCKKIAGRDLPEIDPSKKTIRVAFIAQHPQGWTNFESVREAMVSDDRFEVVVVSTPYLHPYPPEGGQEAIYAFLDKHGIPHRRWDSGILHPDFADIAFVQNPYDVTRPPILRTATLMKLVPRLAYIPYGLEIGGGQENSANQYNLPLQKFAWMVFARSVRQKATYALQCGSGNSHVAVTGHPKLDSIRKNLRNTNPEILKFADSRKVFLWNPQFDIRPNGTGFSTFLIWNEYFIKEFKRRRDICLIIRPHPVFFGTLESRKIWDRQRVEHFLRQCEEAKNILIDRNPNYMPVFGLSSALISDASSFLLEYAFTGKPILYLPNPKGPQLNEDGEFVNKFLCRGETEASIATFLDNVIQGVDEKKSQRMESLREFLELPTIGAGVAIKESLLAQLAKDAIVDHNFNPANAAISHSKIHPLSEG